MDYKVIENNTLFDVIETATDRVVYTHSSYSQAKKIMKHLNLGGGFAGFTPNFFQKVVPVV